MEKMNSRISKYEMFYRCDVIDWKFIFKSKFICFVSNKKKISKNNNFFT